MEDRDKVIRALHEKLNELARQQKMFQAQIETIQRDISKLETTDNKKITAAPQEHSVKNSPSRPPLPQQPSIENIARPLYQQKKPVFSSLKKEKSQLEEFIGTNLLNKIGIGILVTGIGFGAKYSIEHQLLDPLTRIILGYVAGMVLIGVAFRLKKAHVNFSAVLLSGGMAVLYFLTYAAYDFYSLIPQIPAFALMVIFTAFTVFAAIQYNKEVIGIIGLVGAYAVPFLLSDGSGRVAVLFSYMTIINSGILILAFKKYWKRLYYSAFSLTWLTFMAWYSLSYEDKYLILSLGFSTIFSLTFYVTFLAYKLIRKDIFSKTDLVFMLMNSFIYYAYGYISIEMHDNGQQFLGLFTLGNAILHFIALVALYKKHQAFRDTFYFVAAMVLVFLTLAIPVQLEGNWVTVIWAAEAALMFWIGRTKAFPAYEKLSYPLVALTFFSLLHD